MATFPSYARILDQGYGEEPDYGVLRSETDGPIAKQRPRWSKAVWTFDVQIQVISYANKELFDAWVDEEISGGAGWFNWTNPNSGKTKQARIVGGKYKWAPGGGTIWIAPCQLETVG